MITVDEPSLSVTIGINTSPLAGQDGKQADRQPGQGAARRASWSATSRCASLETERPDAWEVQGRGELQLAVLVEMMRREGFELTVGKPQVVTREIDGKLHEPVERMTVDVPEEYVGVDHPAAGAAQGPAWSRWSTTAPAGCGWSTSCRRAG